MGKWLAQATRKVVKRTEIGPKGSCGIFEGRPALEEFMRSIEGADGTGREPSAVMFALSDDGVRVGLKDDDQGGWLWREGDSLQGGLDSIEKALQSGAAVFKGPQGGKRQKK